MKIRDIITKQIRYTPPQFEVEYDEALRYPKFQNLSKEQWVRLCNTGKPLLTTASFLSKLNNTEATSVEEAREYYNDLDLEKRQRFEVAFKAGTIEMPIVVFMDGHYELLGGNTRATGLVAKGIMPKVWLINA